MTPDERKGVNLSVLGSERALAAWIGVANALQRFGNATGALAGTDLLHLYAERSEACFAAQAAAARPAETDLSGSQRSEIALSATDEPQPPPNTGREPR